MLYAVFGFLSPSYILLSASAFQYVMERILSCGQSKYKGQAGWGGVFGKPKLKLNNFVYIPEGCLCPITFCNYKCINISPFTSSAVFHIFMCIESE